MELQVYNRNGQDTGRKVVLSDEVFGIEPNQHAVYLDVKQYLANQRQGTHKSKERAEINRTTKKLKKQKGTGGARAGSMKSPLFVGGGRVFGPRPRDYSFKLNRKLKALARRSAIAAKLRENSLMVLEDFNFDTPSTKNYAAFLQAFTLNNKKTLFVLPEANANLQLSSRNLQKARVISVENLNTYELLNAESVMLSEKTVEKLEALLAAN